MDDWPLPDIDLERCNGCGRCVEYCPTSSVELGPDETPLIVRPRDCAYCGLCEELCPEGAIALAYEIVCSST